jgi:hypothetical protein
MYYRCAFNMWAAILQDLESVGAAVSALIGRAIPPLAFYKDTLQAGTAADWPEVNIAALVSGTAELGALFAALAEGGAVVAGLQAFALALLALAPSWAVVAAGDAATGTVALRLEPSAGSRVTAMSTSVQIGFPRLENVPIDAAKHAGALVEAEFRPVKYALQPAPSGVV